MTDPTPQSAATLTSDTRIEWLPECWWVERERMVCVRAHDVNYYGDIKRVCDLWTPSPPPSSREATR